MGVVVGVNSGVGVGVVLSTEALDADSVCIIVLVGVVIGVVLLAGELLVDSVVNVVLPTMDVDPSTTVLVGVIMGVVMVTEAVSFKSRMLKDSPLSKSSPTLLVIDTRITILS